MAWIALKKSSLLIPLVEILGASLLLPALRACGAMCENRQFH